jgi:1-acyl-sn-glycerol-3-phosphate acyltransferase
MSSVHWVNACLIGFAFAGWWASRRIPPASASDPGLAISFDWVAQYRRLYEIAHQKQSVLLSIIGISWFWFFGSLVITQLPNFVKYTIGGDEWVATLFFGLFTISISIGSLLTTKLSGTSIELGMVPLGALGLSVFAFDLGIIDYGNFQAAGIGVMGFVGGGSTGSIATSARVMLDIGALGISGSFFIVPLYALLQHRSEDRTRSQVIAASNVAGALFMVASSATVMALYAYGLTAPQLFIVVAAMNLAASFYVFRLLPEFVLRFGIWALASTVYRLRYQNQQAIPRHGACLLVANHVSFIDWLVVTATCQRPVHFVMYYKIFDMPFLRPLFKLCKAIPIASATEDPECKERAFDAIAEYLSKGEIVCIFPEGKITYDGKLDRFRRGVEQVLETSPVSVIPIGLNGLWGSFFSRERGAAMRGWPKPRRRLIEVVVGREMSAESSAAELEEAVQGLLRDA